MDNRNTITLTKEELKPQTASGGLHGGNRGGNKAPPMTPYKKRPHKVGDRVMTKDHHVGIIVKIKSNGVDTYLVSILKIGDKWYSEFEVN
jgi:hypothetical protein